MLGGAYQWDRHEGGAILRLRYGCAAAIKTVDGIVLVSIFWRGREVRGRDTSIEKAMLHVERWLAARARSPLGLGKRFVLSDDYQRRQAALGALLRACTRPR